MADIARQSALPFSRVGAYEIERLLGAGSMANVYAGRHTGNGRLAAVKVLHSHLALDRVATARFLREARVLARMHHPNLAEVFDVGEEDTPYFAMTLVEGEDLTQYMRRLRPMSMRRIAECMLPVIDAVAAVHAAGVVHRDLKPSNIRVARDARGTVLPKVLDFGLSKLQEDLTTSELTETGAALGTLSYMSPEQVRSANRVDARSDVYALGALLYECATGTKPFRGESSYDLMHAILTTGVTPPSHFRPDVSPAFDAMVARAMAREASERFASAEELGHALAACVSNVASSPPLGSEIALRTNRPSGVIRARLRGTGSAAPMNVAVPTLGFRLIQVAELHVSVWLHTLADPDPAEWTNACRQVAESVRARGADPSYHRMFAVTDGAAPDARQRKECNQDALGGYPVRIAVVTTILRTSPVKRGIATALQWLNPHLHFFEPQDVIRAVAHLGISPAQFEPIWACLLDLQHSLPPVRTLRLIENELGVRFGRSGTVYSSRR